MGGFAASFSASLSSLEESSHTKTPEIATITAIALYFTIQKVSLSANCTRRGLFTVEFTAPKATELTSLTGRPNWA
jgi:hypothetical protein